MLLSTGGNSFSRDSVSGSICLISIPTATDFEEPVHFESEDVRMDSADIPLGMLALAAVLERSGFVPQIVDSNLWYREYLFSGSGHNASFAHFAAERLASSAADVFGFGTICNSYPVTLQMAEHLKALRPGAMILLGGPQASVVDVATLQNFPFVDFVLRGEADQTLPEFVSRVSQGSAPENVAGLTYRCRREVRRNPDAPVPTDLDTLPIPAFHLYPAMEDRNVLPLELGRGCPFSCTFCSTNDFFRRRFRLKSPAKLIEEMDFLLARYEVEFFDLMHDMFTVDRKRVVAICEAILATGRSYRWGCSARTDCVDQELIELMAHAGCVSIFFGIESGSARMQKIIDKCLDLEEARINTVLTSRNGMKTTVSMITGFPEETKEDVRQSLAFLGEALLSRNTTPQLHLLAPLSGTPLQVKHLRELILEDIYTDISHAGLVQRSAERQLIARYPNIFPNFYAIPTPYLDRRYLHELREFVMRTSRRFRWMMAALHERCGDLLGVYEEWRTWSRDLVPRECGSDLRRYYCTWEFDQHFVQFLANLTQARSEFEAVLLAFEEKLIQVIRPSNANECDAPRLEVLESDMRLELETHVYLLHLKGDVNRVVELLEAHGLPDESVHRPTIVATRLVTGEEVEVIEVPPLTAKFLALCDGNATVDEVLRRFEPMCQPVGRLSAWDVATYALQTAYECKLIRALAAEGKSELEMVAAPGWGVPVRT